jgi:hypothetical protein
MAEFGSWEGASAIIFLESADNLGLDLKLICVDTWLGSAEHWDNSFPNSEWSFERLGVVGGEPTVIETFRKSLRTRELLDKVEIVRAPTTHAVSFIAGHFPTVGLVYIDADHGFRAVSSDLQAAGKILAPGGLIAGDDWAWMSVRLAVAKFCLGTRAILVSPDGTTYVLPPRGDRPALAKFRGMGWQRESPSLIITLGWIAPSLRRTAKSSKKVLDRFYTSVKGKRSPL